ncbi:MAG: PadR family transcriptional regulator [Gemmatimonadota bacterium]
MAEPKLTHLQFVILGLIQEGATSGKELRAALRDDGMRKSGPSFYQLMARLEDSGWVAGEYRQRVVEGQTIRERHYDLTPTGTRALQASTAFYARWIGRFARGVAPA